MCTSTNELAGWLLRLAVATVSGAVAVGVVLAQGAGITPPVACAELGAPRAPAPISVGLKPRGAGFGPSIERLGG